MGSSEGEVIEDAKYPTPDCQLIMSVEVASRLMRAGLRPTGPWEESDRDPSGQWVEWKRGYGRTA
jgi:hypothetical protein